ncbi:MAG: DUF4246 family protein [Myxococcales bacterium]|nr:MAG: DUF4246 family protein [Myxococcales bacterium]
MTPTDHPTATGTDFSFVRALLEYGEEYEPQPGDTIDLDLSDITSPVDGLPAGEATVVSVDDDGALRLRAVAGGQETTVDGDTHVAITDSPAARAIVEAHARRPTPDGVAFSDTSVPAELTARLRRGVQRLAEMEPVDHHPGSGTRVRDLVHPSLYPYVQGTSPVVGELPDHPPPSLDRFGRPHESSRYQWLPTPFRIAADGTTTIDGYINNLDAARHGDLQGDLGRLFTCVLPLVESVLGYVAATRFWTEGSEVEHEGELPRVKSLAPVPVAPRSLRGRELQVIPKIVEYRLGAGETHEGVWHVEGMSHEHIVATCVVVLERDACLQGGELSFKRAYTLEEAGHLFWNIDQSRPRFIENLVEEGTIPVGAVATPEGRVVVFPNSHIHRLDALTVAAGATGGRRRVIVFWVVDPDVAIASTREVPPQQGTMSREEALAIRLALMEERRLHKATFNPRAVSLCEH